MKKSHITIMIILSIFILFTGCINTNNNNNTLKADDDLREYDVTLYIKNKSENISNESESIIIELILTNKENQPIQIYKYGLITCFISIIDPENITYDINRGNITISEEKKILAPDEKYSIKINLKKELFENQTYGELKWNKVGTYKCQAIAYYIESNWIAFEIN